METMLGDILTYMLSAEFSCKSKAILKKLISQKKSTEQRW